MYILEIKHKIAMFFFKFDGRYLTFIFLLFGRYKIAGKRL